MRVASGKHSRCFKHWDPLGSFRKNGFNAFNEFNGYENFIGPFIDCGWRLGYQSQFTENLFKMLTGSVALCMYLHTSFPAKCLYTAVLC